MKEDAAKNVTKVIILFTFSHSFFFRFLTSFKIHSGNRHSGLNIPAVNYIKKISGTNVKCSDFDLKDSKVAGLFLHN